MNEQRLIFLTLGLHKECYYKMPKFTIRYTVNRRTHQHILCFVLQNPAGGDNIWYTIEMFPASTLPCETNIRVL